MSLPTTASDFRQPHNQPQNQQQPRHNALTLSYAQLVSLLGSMILLKLLHALSTVSRGRKPSQQILERAEQRIVTGFQSIIPESVYLNSDLPYYPYDGTRSISSSRLGETSLEEVPSNMQSPVLRITPSIFPAIQMSQYLSRASANGGMELFRATTGSSNSNNNNGNRSSPTHLSSVPPPQMTPLSKAESFSSTVSVLGCVAPHNSPVTTASSLQGTTTVHGGAIAVMERSSNVPVTPAAPAVPPMPVKEQQQQTQQQPSVDYENDELHISNTARLDQEILEMDGLQTTRSAESFPGKFPVSDGLDLGALATAPIQVKGKGTTSVRPFSDV